MKQPTTCNHIGMLVRESEDSEPVCALCELAALRAELAQARQQLDAATVAEVRAQVAQQTAERERDALRAQHQALVDAVRARDKLAALLPGASNPTAKLPCGHDAANIIYGATDWTCAECGRSVRAALLPGAGAQKGG